MITFFKLENNRIKHKSKKPFKRCSFPYSLFVVDNDKKYLEISKKRISKFFSEKTRINFIFSEAEMTKYNGKYTSQYRFHPLVNPDFIYVDGPGLTSVRERIRGLGFDEKNRRMVNSDVLLYESSSPSDFFILVDRMYVTMNFLINNLKYKYTLKKDLALGIVTFEKKYQPYP